MAQVRSEGGSRGLKQVRVPNGRHPDEPNGLVDPSAARVLGHAPTRPFRAYDETKDSQVGDPAPRPLGSAGSEPAAEKRRR